MFLLVDFSPRHVFPTANWVSESCERGFSRQVGGTVPAVSPKSTSAHSFSILQWRHYTFLTHFTVHDEAYFIHRSFHVYLSRPRATRGKHENFTSCMYVSYVHNTNISPVGLLCLQQDFDTRFCFTESRRQNFFFI